MSVANYKRGIPTYKDKDDNEFGLLCETKEVCVTDDDGVSLEYKLQMLMQNIKNLTSELKSCAKVSDLSNCLPLTGGTLTGRLTVHNNIKVATDYDENAAGIILCNADETIRGIIGCYPDGTPFYTKDWSAQYLLLHTGNSAPSVIVPSDPGIGASVPYADGTLIFVKE